MFEKVFPARWHLLDRYFLFRPFTVRRVSSRLEFKLGYSNQICIELMLSVKMSWLNLLSSTLGLKRFAPLVLINKNMCHLYSVKVVNLNKYWRLKLGFSVMKKFSCLAHAKLVDIRGGHGAIFRLSV